MGKLEKWLVKKWKTSREYSSFKGSDSLNILKGVRKAKLRSKKELLAISGFPGLCILCYTYEELHEEISAKLKASEKEIEKLRVGRCGDLMVKQNLTPTTLKNKQKLQDTLICTQTSDQKLATLEAQLVITKLTTKFLREKPPSIVRSAMQNAIGKLSP